MMAANRYYPSWLPPNPRERTELLRIRRRQRAVIVWLVGFIPAGWAVIALTRSLEMTLPLTVVWIAAGAWMGRRVITIRCPRCGGNFCEQPQLPYWYGLFNHRCENCGLSLNPDRIDEV